MNKITDLLSRWNETIRRAIGESNENQQGLNLIILSVFTDVLAKKYMVNDRFYHNFDHIHDCLCELDVVKDKVDNLLALQLAFWFHDVEYITGAYDNEMKSAQVAETTLRNLGVNKHLIKQVYELILATAYSDTFKEPLCYRSEDVSINDTLIMRDIDLQGFSKDISDVMLAGHQIFRESSAHGVSRSQFLEGRKKFLGMLLSIEFKLYHSSWFESREGHAKGNISTELIQLNQFGLECYTKLGEPKD